MTSQLVIDEMQLRRSQLMQVISDFRVSASRHRADALNDDFSADQAQLLLDDYSSIVASLT